MVKVTTDRPEGSARNYENLSVNVENHSLYELLLYASVIIDVRVKGQVLSYDVAVKITFTTYQIGWDPFHFLAEDRAPLHDECYSNVVLYLFKFEQVQSGCLQVAI